MNMVVSQCVVPCDRHNQQAQRRHGTLNMSEYRVSENLDKEVETLRHWR